jgi:hypothetical protein
VTNTALQKTSSSSTFQLENGAAANGSGHLVIPLQHLVIAIANSLIRAAPPSILRDPGGSRYPHAAPPPPAPFFRLPGARVL